MALIVPEKNHVEALKRAFELVGPLYPVLVDQNGKVLQGNNRLATGKDWGTPRTVVVESKLQELLIRLVGNVQKQPKEEEVKYLLNKIAEDVVVNGIKLADGSTQKIPEAEACTEICKMLSPRIYTDRRIRQLLETKYKVGYKADAGRKGDAERKGGESFAETISANTDEVDSGKHGEEVMAEADEEAKNEKTLMDDLSKKADGSPAYPFPEGECKCPTCDHKDDCY